MKVKNETNYDTRYLRKLFLDCERHEGTNPKYRHVRVIYARSYRVSGKAWLHSSSVVMKLPKGGAHAHSVAQVYIHEVGHNLGLRHKDMAYCSSINVDWLPLEELPFKAVKPKPKQNLVEVRAAHAQKKLMEWEKKFKRAKTFVQKYSRKVKYYDRKMAASPRTESS